MVGARQPADDLLCADWKLRDARRDRGWQAHSGGHRDLSLARLAESIETDVIPRLMLAHGSGQAMREPHGPMPGREDVEEFARLILQHDVKVASAYIDVLQQRGIATEVLLLQVMAPAARLLGDLWLQDICTFTDVTVGLVSMRQILRDLTKGAEREPSEAGTGGRALLTTVPGEQHTFGLYMLEDFFRRAGWSVCVEVASSELALGRRVLHEKFDVIGISTSCDHLLDQLGSIIQSLRRASLNGGVHILVGGRVFLERPELVPRVGADTTAADGRQMAALLPTLLKSRMSHS